MCPFDFVRCDSKFNKSDKFVDKFLVLQNKKCVPNHEHDVRFGNGSQRNVGNVVVDQKSEDAQRNKRVTVGVDGRLNVVETVHGGENGVAVMVLAQARKVSLSKSDIVVKKNDIVWNEGSVDVEKVSVLKNAVVLVSESGSNDADAKKVRVVFKVTLKYLGKVGVPNVALQPVGKSVKVAF